MTLTRYVTPTTRAATQPRADMHPALGAVVGAVVIAFSAVLVRVADVTPESAAFFRCLYALPALGLIASVEQSRFGPRTGRTRLAAFAAGAFLGVDLVLWHHAIEAVGAGLSTVLANLQVVIVGLIAWGTFGEKPDPRLLWAIPLSFGGVVLISGVLEEGAFGADPAKGVIFGILTSLAYSAFLLLLRGGGREQGRPAGPLFDATLAAATTAAILGAVMGRLDLSVPGRSHIFLVMLALGPQVIGWLLISLSLARLPTAVTSLLLLVQSAAAVLLGILLLREAPSSLQMMGVTLVLTGVFFGARSQRKQPAAESTAS